MTHYNIDNIDNSQQLWRQMGNRPDAADEMVRALEKARRYRCGKLTQRLIRYYRLLFLLSLVVIANAFVLPDLGMSTLTSILYALIGLVTGTINMVDLQLVRGIDSYMGEPCAEAVRKIRKVRTHLRRGLYIGFLSLIPVLGSFFYDIVKMMDYDPAATAMLYGAITGGLIGLLIGLRMHFRMQRQLNSLYDAFNTEE